MTLLGRLAGLTRSTRARAAAGASAWSVGGYATTTALRFVSRIVLAKLLPNASPLGTVAIVATILAGLELVSDLGIATNIVQHKRGADPVFLGTAFSVQVMRGVALWAIACLLAFPASWLYHDPQLAPLLLFGAVSVLLRGFTSPALAIMTRQLQLRIPTLISVSSEAVGFAVTLAWAIKAPSAWALVAGTVATSALLAGGSHLVGGRIGFRWDREAARGIVRFGGWILIATGTWFLGSRGETLMLKGSIPDIEFGCFAFGSMLVTTPATAITQVGTQVFFPMMSSWLRDEPSAAFRQYFRARWMFTGLAICFAAGSILVGPLFVRLLHLNASFAALGWIVQMLGFRAAVDILATPLSNLLLASGASHYSARGNAIRLTATIVGLIVALPRWGLSGAVFALCGAQLLAYTSVLPGSNRLLPGVVRLELAHVLIFLVASAVGVAFFFLASSARGWHCCAFL
jgi:O-antigen/teichoic acid export membrane protein